MYAAGIETTPSPVVSADPMDAAYSDAYYSPYDDQDTTMPPNGSAGPGDQGATVDAGRATPTSTGNVRAADPLPNSKAALNYYGHPDESSATPAQDKFREHLTNPDAYGANPKSSIWRRLGGALIDTAGTWASGFGVPRQVTHHLAQDVRYGADAAHAKEQYGQELPLLGEAAQQEAKQQEIGYKNRSLDEMTQYRLLQQQRLRQQAQEQADAKAETARNAALGRADKFGGVEVPTGPTMTETPQAITTPGVQPEGQALPPGSQGPMRPPSPDDQVAGLPSRSTQLMMAPKTQNMVPSDWPREPIPAAPSGPATERAIPDAAYRAEQLAATKLIDTPADLLTKGFPAKMTEPDVVKAMMINGKEKPLKDMYEEVLSAPEGTYPPEKVAQARRFQKLHLADNPAIVVHAEQVARDKAAASPEDIEHWGKSVMSDAKNWGLIQGNKELANGVRSWLSTHGADVNQIDAQTRDASKFAKTALSHIPKISQLVDRLDKADKLGPVMGRWNDFMAGKVGKGDKDFTALRDNIMLLDTAMGRVHGGARGGGSEAMMNHFKSMLNADKMDASTLKSGMGVFQDWLTTYANMVPSSAGPTGDGSGGGNGVPKPGETFNGHKVLKVEQVQ